MEIKFLTVQLSNVGVVGGGGGWWGWSMISEGSSPPDAKNSQKCSSVKRVAGENSCYAASLTACLKPEILNSGDKFAR